MSANVSISQDSQGIWTVSVNVTTQTAGNTVNVAVNGGLVFQGLPSQAAG